MVQLVWKNLLRKSGIRGVFHSWTPFFSRLASKKTKNSLRAPLNWIATLMQKWLAHVIALTASALWWLIRAFTYVSGESPRNGNKFFSSVGILNFEKSIAFKE
ncbi:hypothetical protein PR048_012696 [Dryococelus australis]|uniref:Uncharacterized protein n=1 Tax=Dryococelus australis TaxID=614101 RepID=A0ABQ9HQ36_9NEOP|nr:hypothetical protein PR048_012696 [Dryococelus australis]